MRALIIALLLLSLPSLAGENPSGTFRPLGADEVPSPIPEDFPCIEVHWQPHTAVYQEDGARVDFFDAPHSQERRALLEDARRSGRAILVACKVQDT